MFVRQVTTEQEENGGEQDIERILNGTEIKVNNILLRMIYYAHSFS